MARISELLNMRVGDTFVLKGDAFHILSRTVFAENTYSWTEYSVRNNYGELMCLSVEGESQYISLSESIDIDFQGRTQIEYDGVTFNLKERGRARVVEFDGDTDVDLNEEMEYWDYSDDMGNEQIEIEIWEDGVDASFAVSLAAADFVVKRGYETRVMEEPEYYEPRRRKKSLGQKVFKGVIIFFIVIIGITIIGNIASPKKDTKAKASTGIFKSKNVKAYIKDSPKYEYSTSLTSEEGKYEQADVYETDLSVEKAGVDLAMNCEPKEQSDMKDSDSISLLYDDYYVFIYEGDESKTFVQLSTREYTYHTNNTLYRPRYRHQDSFFRDYYFYKALTSDRRRYGDDGYYSYYEPRYRGSRINNYSRNYYDDDDFDYEVYKSPKYKSTGTTKYSNTTKTSGGSGVKKYSNSSSGSSGSGVKKYSNSSSGSSGSGVKKYSNSSSGSSSTSVTKYSSGSSSTSRSSSVRRYSTSTRRSSGGGTSFGK